MGSSGKGLTRRIYWKKKSARLTDKGVSPRTNCRAVAKSTVGDINKIGVQYWRFLKKIIVIERKRKLRKTDDENGDAAML